MIGETTEPQWAKQRQATLADLGQWLGALDPNAVQIDDRTVKDSLSFAASYSKLINFYDLQNRENSNWSGFFLKDPTILMAVISQTEFSGIHEQYLQLQKRLNFLLGEGNRRSSPELLVSISEAINQTFSLTMNLFVEINSWLLSLNSDHHSYPLKEFVYKKAATEIAHLLDRTMRLRTEFKRIDAPNYLLTEGFVDQLKAPGTYIGKPNEGQDSNQPHSDSKSSENEQKSLAEANTELCEIYENVFSFFVQVIDGAKTEYSKLAAQGNGYPDTSLLIAFSKLLQIQRQQLNGVTEKHLEFYYQNILKQTAAGASPDELYLSIELAQKTHSLKIPAGTEFFGSAKSAGSPIVFSSVKDRIINKIKVVQVRTLFYGVGPENTDKKAEKKLQSKKLYSRQIDKPSQRTKNQQGEILSWPLFGAFGGNTTEVLSDEPPKHQLGFALASPMLYLQGGAREITIDFTFSDPIKLEPLLGPLKGNDVYLSSTNGWFKVAKKSFNLTYKNKVLTLLINLQSTDLAVLPLVDKTAKQLSKWPAVKLLLGDDINLSTSPSLNEISINTKITGFNHVDLYSGETKLKSSGFLPFGPIAQRGNDLNIVSNELSAKQVNQLQLDVNWDNLPSNFEAYYQAFNSYLKTYGSSNAEPTGSYFQNNAFYGEFSIRSLKIASENTPDEIKPLYPLVCTTLFTPPLLDTPASSYSQPQTLSSVFKLLTGDLKYVTNPEPQILLAPNSPASETFIQIQLAMPTHGFGSDLYSKVTANVTYENAQLLIRQANGSWTKIFQIIAGLVKKIVNATAQKKAKTKVKPLPNLPFVPKVRSLSINYTANQVYDLTQAPQSDAYPLEFYHLGSFAEYQVYDANKATAALGFGQLASKPSPVNTDLIQSVSPLALWPKIVEGSVYISLAGVDQACTLSIFFELRASSLASQQQGKKSDISFCYLSKTGWRKLVVLSDSTEDFCQSGVIDVQITEDIATNSELMGDPNCWIAAFVENGARTFSGVVFVDTQIIKARRLEPSQVARGEKIELAAGQITGTKQPQPAIASVHQLLASSGGKSAETKGEFYQRVSRRIRNKNRVSTIDDYVESVLHRFPDVYFAVCSKQTFNSEY
jgi:hypothetical protein